MAHVTGEEASIKLRLAGRCKRTVSWRSLHKAADRERCQYSWPNDDDGVELHVIGMKYDTASDYVYAFVSTTSLFQESAIDLIISFPSAARISCAWPSKAKMR